MSSFKKKISCSNKSSSRTLIILVAVFMHADLVYGEAAKQIACESTAVFGFHYFKAEKGCLMNGTTTIDSLKFTIASEKDETMKGLSFDSNKKIKFLPEAIHEKFPNLSGLSAAGCSIKSITASNFNRLTALTHLYLHYNQIEQISGKMFQDLTSLTSLSLSEFFKSFVSSFS